MKKNSMIGKQVIVRAKNAGVFFGTLAEKTESNNVVMQNVRKLWYWDGACAVEQIAVDGVNSPKTSKFTIEVAEMEITEAIQIIPCTEKAIESIKNVAVWKK